MDGYGRWVLKSFFLDALEPGTTSLVLTYFSSRSKRSGHGQAWQGSHGQA